MPDILHDPPFEIDTFEPIEPPWQAIKQWISADDDEPSFHWQDAHHSNESSWKPREIPLDDGRILILDADRTRLTRISPQPPNEKSLPKKLLAQRTGKLCL